MGSREPSRRIPSAKHLYRRRVWALVKKNRPSQGGPWNTTFWLWMKKLRQCLGRKACQLGPSLNMFADFRCNSWSVPNKGHGKRIVELAWEPAAGVGWHCWDPKMGRVDHRGGIHIGYPGEGPKHDQLQIWISIDLSNMGFGTAGQNLWTTLPDEHSFANGFDRKKVMFTMFKSGLVHGLGHS